MIDAARGQMAFRTREHSLLVDTSTQLVVTTIVISFIAAGAIAKGQEERF